MTAASRDTERHVIPRWRSLSQTLSAGEFERVASKPLTREQELELTAAQDEWTSVGGVSRASEFVSVALILGVPERARDAADLLATTSGATRSLANAAISHAHPGQREIQTAAALPYQSLITEISQLKAITLRDPRNAVAWLDLARHYATVGLREKAERAMFIATRLAPTNRFVVRSAVAFYSHIGDVERGHHLVRRHPRLRQDPWLLAADLAATAEANGRQVNVRHARSLVEGGLFSPIALSELASELGSMEAGAGSKRAKRLFATAMVDPTENAAAQAEWAVRDQPRMRTWEDSVSQPGEPTARHRERLRDWSGATEHGEFWLLDQPFSIDAAAFASYAAAMKEDFVRGAQLAESGTRANPTSIIVNNNFAYCLVQIGDLTRAKQVLDSLPMGNATDSEKAVILATSGLLELRLGNQSKGVAQYQRAIESAHAAKNEALEAQAWLMLATELLAAGPDDGGAAKKAVAVSRSRQEPFIQELLDRLVRRLQRRVKN